MRLTRYLLLLISVASLFAGCSVHRPPEIGHLPEADIELTTTPFFPQKEYQCGPAALATLLVSADVPTLPDLLSPNLYIPNMHGSLQLEIVASIRDHDRVPYQIGSTIKSIIAELNAGRTVLILQNLGLETFPIYHYAVVIGVTSEGQIILRSGTTERLLMNAEKFLSTWEKAGKWGVIALKSHELPTDNDILRYLKDVAAIEATGNVQFAEQCYTTVLHSFPDNDIAMFGLANTMLAQHNFTTAAIFYSYLLKFNPDHAEATNNLAESFAALKCYDQAVELLDVYLSGHSEPSFLTTFLTKTRNEIETRRGNGGHTSKDCSEILLLIDL